MEIFNWFFMFLGTMSLFFFICFLGISLGYRKNNTCYTVGYLNKKEHSKNVYVGLFAGRRVKDWVDFCYIYTVEGKQYAIKHGSPGKPDNLNNVVRIVYQKNNPNYSYIKDLTMPVQPVIAVLLGILSVIFLLVGIFA